MEEKLATMNENNASAGLTDLLKAGGLPELGPGPRAAVLPAKELSQRLDELLMDTKISDRSGELVRGLVLLWHDHFEMAHEIAQAIENTDGSFLHGILHRREPDYGNATYWFRRVGQHESFPDIARRASELLKSQNKATIAKQLIRNDEWNPYGFIGLCEKAAGKSASDGMVQVLKEIQGIETEVLLAHWMA